MDTGLGKVVKKKLKEWYNRVKSEDKENQNYDRFVFTDCRNVKPKVIEIRINLKNLDWQVGFFDADGEVYFDEIDTRSFARFSSIVRNYWQNGKEGEEKKEGYYSLIKLVKKLTIWEEEHISDLLDYVEGRYEVGEYWQRHKLDRNIKLRIYSKLE